MEKICGRVEERDKEWLPEEGVHNDVDDLIIFRWLDKQISNKKAITACLLVLQGSACSEEPLDEDQVATT